VPYPAIDWNTPAASFVTIFSQIATYAAASDPRAADPWGATQLYTELVWQGGYYDRTVAQCNASVARDPLHELTPAARDAALTPTSDATNRAVSLIHVVDLLTRIVAQANLVIPLFPWNGRARPAGLVVGWPWV
jgi:hypothetical protein